MKCNHKITVILVALTSFFSCTDFQEEHDAPSGLSFVIESLSFPETESSKSIRVISGSKWRINSLPEWLEVQAIDNKAASLYEWTIVLSSQLNRDYDKKGTIILGTADESVEIPVEKKGQKGTYIALESVSISPAEVTITKGKTLRLTATVNPSNASEKTVKWSSSNTSVATVSDAGLVRAVEVGTATVSVTTDDGGKTATCAVTVTPVSVAGVSLDKTSLTMKVGDTQTLVATVSPSDAADKSVSWSSSNTSVAAVSSSGVVTAKAVGTATITVKTNDGGRTATCSVTVNPINVTGVSLNKNSMSLLVGETQTLTATVSPNNATDKSVTWSSDNTSVATVSSSGVVTAKAVGTATITVTTKDGGKTATCSVTVKSKDISGSGNENTGEEELF